MTNDLFVDVMEANSLTSLQTRRRFSPFMIQGSVYQETHRLKKIVVRADFSDQFKTLHMLQTHWIKHTYNAVCILSA